MFAFCAEPAAKGKKASSGKPREWTGICAQLELNMHLGISVPGGNDILSSCRHGCVLVPLPTEVMDL